MDEELKAYLQGMESRMQEYTDQRLATTETRLVSALRNSSHPVEARLRVQKTTTRAFNERLDAIEDRVEFLEEQAWDRSGAWLLPKRRLS